MLKMGGTQMSPLRGSLRLRTNNETPGDRFVSSVAYISEVITDRLNDTLTHRKLPTLTAEPTAGHLARMILVLALDPRLLLSNLDGFDSTLNDHAGIFPEGIRDSDQLR